MNKKVILITLCVVMLSTVSYAQKVIVSNNRVIIDCSGMRPFYSDKKIEPRTTTATNTASRTNGAADISSPQSNANVYKIFEVHKISAGFSSWKDAVFLCANLDSNGTGWRLPTQRELLLMQVLKGELKSVGVLSRFSYWSATEWDASESWSVNFNGGGTEIDLKTESKSNEVRCVRDI